MSDEQPPPPSAEQNPSSTTAVIAPPGEEGQGTAPPPFAPITPSVTARKDKPVATSGEVAIVLIAGFLGNIALRTTIGGFAGALVFALAVMLVAGRVTKPSAYIPLGLAAALIPWLAIRSSVALTFATFVMIGVLLLVSGGFSMRGSFFNTRVREIVAHLMSPIYEWAIGSAMVQRLVARAAAQQKAVPLLRGVMVAVPVLIVFTALLASAEPVFARVLQLDNLPSLVGHLALTAVVAVPLLTVLSRAAHELDKDDESSINLRMVGPTEITVILGSVAVLFTVFVITQIVIAAGGASHVLETEGLTSAEHARQGFFQLLWVAGLASSLVAGLRATRIIEPERGAGRFVPLSLVTLALTVVIAGLSVQRLFLHIGSFGLTTARIWALAAALAIGIAILLFAVSILGWRKEQSWFPGAMVLLAGVMVFGLNLINPDAMVASYNLSNHETFEVSDNTRIGGDDLDIVTIARLSDDAIPTIIDRLGEAPGLRDRICQRSDRFTNYGPFDYNWAEVRADNKLDSLCGIRTQGGDFWNEFAD